MLNLPLRRLHRPLLFVPTLAKREGATIAIWFAVLAASMAMTVVLAAMTGCGGAERPVADDTPIKVISASPADQTYFSAEPIRIHFERPVVATDAIGAVAGALPVAIEPFAELDGRFVDRRTLVLVPKKSLASSTRYRVSLTDELAEKTGDFSFEFVSVPLEVEGVWGIELGSLPATPSLPLHFNQPVSNASVERHCKFESTTDQVVMAAVAGQGSSKRGGGSIIDIRPERPLALDAEYELSCSDLTGDAGIEPMSGEFALTLKTHPKLEIFEIFEVSPDGTEMLEADRTRFTIEFSTPIKLESLRENLKIEPNIDDLEDGLAQPQRHDLQSDRGTRRQDQVQGRGWRRAGRQIRSEARQGSRRHFRNWQRPSVDLDGNRNLRARDPRDRLSNLDTERR